MKVMKNKVVTIEYTLRDDEGTVLDSSEANGPLSYIQGTESIIPGLEAEIEGKQPGDAFKADIEAEDAYGTYNPDLIFDIARDQFEDSENLEEGMQFHAHMNDEVHMLTVKEVKDDLITVDANHPLAGQNLHFEVNITDVREPTPEELEHGHVHDENGMHEDDEDDDDDDEDEDFDDDDYDEELEDDDEEDDDEEDDK